MNKFLRTKSVSQIMNEPAEEGTGLKRVLKAKDLVALGIGAIIGAGIFATTGDAAAGGAHHVGAGPAIVLSYVAVAIACGFCAFCYAEFASLIPIAGSAYTYAYATLGELVAWIIGWDLILEYAVGNVAVAISWSGYFGSLMRSLGINVPVWLLTPSGQQHIDEKTLAQLQATAPVIGGHMLYFNLPAMIVVGLLTLLLIRGVRESIGFNNFVVLVKLVVLAVFIGIGVCYVNPQNWVPFMPNGWKGVMVGASLVFFAYIGFDAVSTAAEETEDPGRNLPIGMIGSLVICTILYVLVSGIMTGLVQYQVLGTADPMATAFETLSKSPNLTAGDHKLLSVATFVVAVGAVFSMTAVLLVFQMGQPRIFFSMARDGLLPPFFAKVHPVYQTPHVTTIMTGAFVGISAGFLDISVVIELCNIGTLFAFVLVAAGVLILRYRDAKIHDAPGRPYQIASVVTMVIGVGMLAAVLQAPSFNYQILLGLSGLLCLASGAVFLNVGPCSGRPFNTPFVPLVPMLGMICCFVLMEPLPATTWIRFVIWLVIGMVVYAAYGIHHSRLNRK